MQRVPKDFLPSPWGGAGGGQRLSYLLLLTSYLAPPQSPPPSDQTADTPRVADRAPSPETQSQRDDIFVAPGFNPGLAIHQRIQSPGGTTLTPFHNSDLFIRQAIQDIDDLIDQPICIRYFLFQRVQLLARRREALE
jgi:hypothetical protein